MGEGGGQKKARVVRILAVPLTQTLSPISGGEGFVAKWRSGFAAKWCRGAPRVPYPNGARSIRLSVSFTPR